VDRIDPISRHWAAPEPMQPVARTHNHEPADDRPRRDPKRRPPPPPPPPDDDGVLHVDVEA
jgi:hypothetical protein